MGNYDLHGNSYKTRQEALNAEMAQCAEIDSRLNRQKIQQIEDQQRRAYETEQGQEYDRDQKIDFLMTKIQELDKRVQELEQK